MSVMNEENKWKEFRNIIKYYTMCMYFRCGNFAE